jgi:ATP phosphoribosyltransferase
MKQELVIAIPKGRILEDLSPLFKKINFKAEDAFYDGSSRKLIFSTNIKNLKIIKVRSFDVATFVKFGAADIGICGLDVLEEFKSPDIYRVLDLGIGKCRLSIATKNELVKNVNFKDKSHVRIASKYQNITRDYFLAQNIQAESIKLNGAMELAPHLNLCDFIVDLVSSGNTLKENNLTEIQTLLQVSSYLVVNRNSFKMKNDEVKEITKMFDVNNLIK